MGSNIGQGVYGNAPEQSYDVANGFKYDPVTRKYVNTATGKVLSKSEYEADYANQQQAAADSTNHAKMLAQGLNDDGSPIRQAWDSLVDEKTGKLKDGYTMSLSGLDPSQWEGYSKYKQEALRTGPSAWAALQNQSIMNQTMANKEAAARQAAAGMNQANSALAMRGGLSAGARGLAARSSARDMLMARQQAARAGDVNTLGVATTDEQNRIAQLANLAGTEQNIGQFNKTLEGKQQEYNINNLIQEQQGKRSYNDMTYQEQMKKWAAGKTADATAAAGSGGK